MAKKVTEVKMSIEFYPKEWTALDFATSVEAALKLTRNGTSLALEPLPSMGSGYFRVCGELGIVKSSIDNEDEDEDREFEEEI